MEKDNREIYRERKENEVKLIPTKLKSKFISFSIFLDQLPLFDDLTDDVILYYIKVYIENQKQKSINSNVEYSADRIKELSEKIYKALRDLEIESRIGKQKPISKKSNKEQKTFTTTTAGIYIANKIGRLLPLSKVSILDRIKKGELKSEKQGNRNVIYEDDLDKFIEIYGDTIRKTGNL